MSVHPFPAARSPRQAGAAPPRGDRVERWLVAGLLLTTAAQIALCAWSWLA